jgi:hypothetical protein
MHGYVHVLLPLKPVHNLPPSKIKGIPTTKSHACTQLHPAGKQAGEMPHKNNKGIHICL